jgi:hypothetical protein
MFIMAEKIISNEINIIITQKNNSPAIELRRLSTDKDFIKAVISAAYHQKPLILQPIFSNKFKALTCLVDKGIIYQDKNTGEYYFTF